MNGRATLFLGAVTGSLVALALVAQVSRDSAAVHLFGVVLIPTLFFLGVATFERVLQSTVQTAMFLRGINRIRHYFTEAAPESARYFVLSTHDDEWDVGLQVGECRFAGRRS